MELGFNVKKIGYESTGHPCRAQRVGHQHITFSVAS